MSRTRSRALASTTAPLALGMAVALVAAPAQASSTSKKDPAGDHVYGSANLDLAKVSMRTKGKQKLEITFGLHNDVTADDLVFPSGVGVDFTTGKKTTRSVKVYSRDGVVQSDVCTYDSREDLPTPKKCSTLSLTQVDGKTFRVEVKRKQLKKGVKVLKWRASALGASAYDPLGTAKKPYSWKL
ncbi:hypothetical protein [Nocardioides campestrisoli]|uniref:hypothetical protein n=1 Tax=Nocardioides campestrisoli TaxID=2736757 RepID=UPI0015E7741A|nr:hypothetical protein [Nocardioides campestrisoli]